VKADTRRESNIVVLRPGTPEDVLTADHELERGAPFCGNPQCALHVRLEDLRVSGGGNWVSLPDGRIFGRSRFDGALLCDACGTRRGPVTLAPALSARR
jgi:hypothetical protein